VALLIEMPQRAAFAPARRLAWAILGVGLAVAALLTVGIYLVARQIARPVLAVTRAAVEVAEGNLGSEAPVLTTDEVGVLARTFNRMTAQLRVLYGNLEQEIAERRRTEEEREDLIRELEAKNTELERFTYTVSHDLKSPLVTIRGFLGLLEKDVAGGDAERIESDLARIRSASEKMTRLLEDLLELSRIGRLVNPPEEIPFGELAREALDLVAGTLTERGVEVSVAPDLPTVHGDRVRLVEVLQNLVENAITAMADQPRPQLEIDAREEGGQVLCRVRDNGKGIDPRYHQKIFGLFERLDPNDRGTGIGLALVQRIVEVHGGRIWVDSEPGHGATFLFTLPAPPTAAAP
jgi:signal transduction histidine kinase